MDKQVSVEKSCVEEKCDRVHSVSTPTKRFFIATVLGALSGMAPICTDLYLPALPQVAEMLHTNATLTQVSLTTSLLALFFGIKGTRTK